jgi:hypothetical protein
MKSFLLIGAGNFGHLLARELSKQPCELMIADISEHALEDLLELGISAKIGDCKREEVLESFDVASFDACFVCVGGHFQTSLEIVYLLKKLHAAKIYCRADDDSQARFLGIICADFLTNLVNIRLGFRHQYVLSTTGDTSCHGQPAGGLAHYLNKYNATMSTGGIAELVYGIHHCISRCIRTNSVIRAPHIIFNGGRNTKNRHAEFLAHGGGTLDAAAATDNDKAFDTMLFQIFIALTTAILLKELSAAGDAKEGTATLNHVAYTAGIKLFDFVINKSLVAVVDTPDMDTLMDCGADYCTNAGVHAWAVVAAG